MVGKSISDDDIVVRMKTVGYLVVYARVLIVGDQAISNYVIFITNIEPDSVSTVFNDNRVFYDSSASQYNFVPSGFPTSHISFYVIVVY